MILKNVKVLAALLSVTILSGCENKAIKKAEVPVAKVPVVDSSKIIAARERAQAIADSLRKDSIRIA